MRNIKNIEADIAKLQAELADVKEEEAMRNHAVHILKNLGWTRLKGKWCPPLPSRRAPKVFDPTTMTHIKEGDFVQSALTSDILYVRKVNSPDRIECSRVLKIQPHGTAVANGVLPRKSGNLRVVDPKDYMGYNSF